MNPETGEFIRLLRDKTPKNMNTVDLLREIIPMSKEAAYRRLRGQIEFSFEEAIRISQTLGISLDGLANINKNDSEKQTEVSSFTMNEDELIEDYIYWQGSSVKRLKELKTYPDHHVMCVKNNVSIASLMKFKKLSKLSLYRWLYQKGSNSRSMKMSDFNVPQRVIASDNMLSNEISGLRMIYIYNKEFLRSMITDTLYFYSMELISEEEKNELREEMFALLEDMESNAISGMNPDAPYKIHVSNLYFESDFNLWYTDHYSHVTFRLMGMKSYIVKDPGIIEELKNWANVLLKCSTLISYSGEKKRTEFFRYQRQQLEELH